MNELSHKEASETVCAFLAFLRQNREDQPDANHDSSIAVEYVFVTDSRIDYQRAGN